jgi:putative nucleotidyltransferase with HDIG domain
MNTSVFNMSNLTLSLGASAWVIELANIKLNLFLTIPLVIIAFMIAEFINFILVAILLKYSQDIKPMLVFRSMLKTFPSTVAIGMLGIFLASVSGEEGNKVIVLVYFIPLLLARYSFKLYFESQRMALDTIHALNEALHAKDAYTGTHTGRVEQYAVDLAGAYGLPTADCELIRTAALLHDIGKIGIPDVILNKPGRLTRDEFERIQEHSSIGAKILGNVNSLKRVSQIIIQHHERYDGSGYPNKLKGDEIDIEAAILMVSDSYDAMTTDRPYRKALTREQAISELIKYSGTQFHPMLTKCFIEGVLNHEEEFDTIEEPSIGNELLVKTRELLEAGFDIPQDALSKEAEALLLEEFIKSEKLKDKKIEEKKCNMTRAEKSRQHPIRIAKESR